MQKDPRAGAVFGALAAVAAVLLARTLIGIIVSATAFFWFLGTNTVLAIPRPLLGLVLECFVLAGGLRLALQAGMSVPLRSRLLMVLLAIGLTVFACIVFGVSTYLDARYQMLLFDVLGAEAVGTLSIQNAYWAIGCAVAELVVTGIALGYLLMRWQSENAAE